MSQFPQCLRLNLADTLSGNVELLADFFQRPCPSVFQAEPQDDNLSFPFFQILEQDLDLLRNVIYSGVWQRYTLITEKKQKQRKEDAHAE